MKKFITIAATAFMTIAAATNVFAASEAALQIQNRITFLSGVEKQLEAAVTQDPSQTLPLQSVKSQIAALTQQLKAIAPELVNQAQTTAVDPAALQAQALAAVQAAQAQAAQPQAATADAAAIQAAQAQALAAAQAQAQALAAAQAAQKAAAAAAQNPQAVQAAAAQAAAQVPSAVRSYTDPFGATTTFTMDEWNFLLSKWAYTGQAEELITHHSVGDLKAVLATR